MRIRLCVTVLILGAFLIGCTPTQPVTPFVAVRFPPTWTPGPTATATPIPPTATLVVRGTRVPAATPDPNFKPLPSIPRDGIGVWLETDDFQLDEIVSDAANVQVVTGPRALAFQEKYPGAFAFLQLGTGEIIPATTEIGLMNKYAGVLIEDREIAPHGTLDDLNVAVEQARRSVGTHLLIADAPVWTDGTSYFANRAAADALLSSVDGICLCNFMRRADTPFDEFKSVTAWRQDVAALATLSSRRDLIVLVSVPFAEPSSKSTGDPGDWLDYSLGSFLLGINNRHAFFTVRGSRTNGLVTAPQLEMKIGSPLGPLYPINGLYERRFTQGVVVVNPSSETRTRVFSRPFQNANNRIVTRATLNPHSAIILFNAE